MFNLVYKLTEIRNKVTFQILVQDERLRGPGNGPLAMTVVNKCVIYSDGSPSLNLPPGSIYLTLRGPLSEYDFIRCTTYKMYEKSISDELVTVLEALLSIRCV